MWVPLCDVTAILADTGICALVDGRQIAVFRLRDGSVHALGNHDPFSGANVLSRGIVGDADGVAFVASPVYKQRFDLGTGVCLDEPTVAVPVHPVRVVAGHVFLGAGPAGDQATSR